MFVPPVSRRSIFFGPFRKIWDIAYVYVYTIARECMRRRENMHDRALLFVCVCRPILKYFPLYLILRESKRDTHGYKYARCVVSLSPLRLILPGRISCVAGWNRRLEARDEFAAHGSANTGFHQDRIQIGNMFTLKTFPSVRPVYIPRCVHRAHWRWRGERCRDTF